MDLKGENVCVCVWGGGGGVQNEGLYISTPINIKIGRKIYLGEKNVL